jgi:hypothetical protein
MMSELTAFGLVLAFGGGLVSFLSPCVLPLVPRYVAWVAGTDVATARAERWRALRLSAFFVFGFGLVFVLLGLGATAIGGMLRFETDSQGLVASRDEFVSLFELAFPLPIRANGRPPVKARRMSPMRDGRYLPRSAFRPGRNPAARGRQR